MNAYTTHSPEDSINHSLNSVNENSNISKIHRPESAPPLLPKNPSTTSQPLHTNDLPVNLNFEKFGQTENNDPFESMRFNGRGGVYGREKSKHMENPIPRFPRNRSEMPPRNDCSSHDSQTWYSSSAYDDLSETDGSDPRCFNGRNRTLNHSYSSNAISNGIASRHKNRLSARSSAALDSSDDIIASHQSVESQNYQFGGYYPTPQFLPESRRNFHGQSNSCNIKNKWSSNHQPIQQRPKQQIINPKMQQQMQIRDYPLQYNINSMPTVESFGLDTTDMVPAANFHNIHEIDEFDSPYNLPSESGYPIQMEDNNYNTNGGLSPLVSNTLPSPIYSYNNYNLPLGIPINSYVGMMGPGHSGQYYITSPVGQHNGLSPNDNYSVPSPVMCMPGHAYGGMYRENGYSNLDLLRSSKQNVGGVRAQRYNERIPVRDRAVSADELHFRDLEHEACHGQMHITQHRLRGNSMQMNNRSASAGESPMSAGLISSPLTIESSKGHIYAMSGDQMGCRQLQQLLAQGGKEAATVVLSEVEDHLVDLMTHPFGNYLFQKLLEHVTVEERTKIITLISHRLVVAGKSLHGTRSVQKVVQMAQTKVERERVVAGLKQGTVQLATDPNGNHVIQRVLQNFATEGDSVFVYKALETSCYEVATHRYGCCVVQRAIDAATLEQRLELVDQVASQALKMMQDPFGNYVVQYVLEKCAAEEVEAITKAPLGHVLTLSSHKFSSNVVEKCLERASPSVKSAYISELINVPDMAALLYDQYANYVLQRALAVGPPLDVALLREVVRPHLAQMRNSTGGRRISLKILKRFPEMAPSLGGVPMNSNIEDSIPMLQRQLEQLRV